MALIEAVLVLLCCSNLPIGHQARYSHKHGNIIDVYSVCTLLFWTSGCSFLMNHHEEDGQQLPKTLLLSPSSEPIFTKKVTLLPVSITPLFCICLLLFPLSCFMLLTASGLLLPLMSWLSLLQWPACRMWGHQHLDVRLPAVFLLMTYGHWMWLWSSSLHMDWCPCLFSIWSLLPANIKKTLCP